MPQLIKSFDEEQAACKDLLFLPPTALPSTTTDCVPNPKTTTVYFVPGEADSARNIPTVKNTP